MSVQLADLHLLGEGDQLLDRSCEADGDNDCNNPAQNQKQHPYTGSESGNDPCIGVQVPVWHQLDNAPFEQGGIDMPVHHNPCEPVLFPAEMAAFTALRKPAPARCHPLPDPIRIRRIQCLSLFIQHIQAFCTGVIHRPRDPLQFVQPEVNRQISHYIGTWRTVEREMSRKNRHRS
ncbi:hypothetical protein D3C75_843540 [compost metagenome]